VQLKHSPNENCFGICIVELMHFQYLIFLVSRTYSHTHTHLVLRRQDTSIHIWCVCVCICIYVYIYTYIYIYICMSRIFRQEAIFQNARFNVHRIANYKVQKNSISEMLPKSVRSTDAYAYH